MPRKSGISGQKEQLHAPAHCSFIHTAKKRNPKHPSADEWKRKRACMVAHAFNPITRDAEADGALSVQDQPGLHSDTPSQKQNKPRCRYRMKCSSVLCRSWHVKVRRGLELTERRVLCDLIPGWNIKVGWLTRRWEWNGGCQSLESVEVQEGWGHVESWVLS